MDTFTDDERDPICGNALTIRVGGQEFRLPLVKES